MLLSTVDWDTPPALQFVRALRSKCTQSRFEVRMPIAYSIYGDNGITSILVYCGQKFSQRLRSFFPWIALPWSIAWPHQSPFLDFGVSRCILPECKDLIVPGSLCCACNLNPAPFWTHLQHQCNGYKLGLLECCRTGAVELYRLAWATETLL